MGIFSRMRDIISSNINVMLDRAEDPEKLIRLMIQEMEDTLVEVKASCAGAIAEAKKVERELNFISEKGNEWAARAQSAVDKGHEDLARQALVEKKRYMTRATNLEAEMAECQMVVERYQDDIQQLEDKLASVREKQRALVQRHLQAQHKRRAQEDMRRADSSDVLTRFAIFENRVERMEAEADLVNFGKRPTLDDQFERIERDEEIEAELKAMQQKARSGGDSTQDGGK
jgi:phage shock protein A